MHIVITGANRGIGLELVRQCLARKDTVTAAVRNPSEAKALRALGAAQLTIAECDVGNDSSVRAFAATVTAPVDALINNAGVMGATDPLGSLDFDDALDTYSVNALGALRVTEALLPRLRAGQGKRVLNVTSGLGSISDNGSGGSYAYRMSKAALNMGTRNLAHDLRPEGVWVAVINPGWVKTDMGGRGAPTEVSTSAAGILRQLDALSAKTTGLFLDHSGKDWPW